MSTLQRSYSRRSSADAPPKRVALLFATLSALLVIGFFAALALGSTDANMLKAISAMLRGDMSDPDYRIMLFVRLPRVVAAVLAGSALAASGVMIQAVLNNAMAAPNIIGVNSGAGFCAILLMAVFPSFVSAIPIAAFLGALGASLCIWAIAARTGASRITVTLVGVAVSSILSAGISTLKTLFPDSVYDATVFMIGGLSGVSWQKLSFAAYMIIFGLICALIFSRGLDILSLGGETARALGMKVSRTRFLYLMLASLLAGAAVSFSGLLGFIGLLVPHIMRRFFGNGHRLLLPSSMLGGAALLLLCDLVARTLFAPYELPVGILLSLIGGPFFITLVLFMRKRELYD